MEASTSHDQRHPVISHPLSRQPSRGDTTAQSTHLFSPVTRPTSPPPRGFSSKTSLFSLIRRSGSTLDSVHSAAEGDGGVSDTPGKKGKGKGKDRWSKRASRKAAQPPIRERGESEELDWERIRTLPRVRLVPPEDEGEPVMLYPVPHPSSLLPTRLRPQAPPTLLSATVAATLATTDRSVTASPPTPPRTASPPEGVVLNSLAHATFMAQQHGHWIGMSDKFILPPPVFSRGPTAATSRASIVMPKTRRQLEADIGRRMSMVEQRKRNSLELDRITLLPPLEEATQSPPNIMLPPVLRSIAEHGEIISIHDFGSLFDDDDDLPLAAMKRQQHPASLPAVQVSPLVAVAEQADHSALAPDSPILPIKASMEPILGPAIQLKSPPKRVSSRHPAFEDDTSPPLVVHIVRPPAEPIPLPTPLPPPVAHSHPLALLPAQSGHSTQRSTGPIAPQVVTRPKRSKSLTAAWSRSLSDDGPSTSTPPPVPMLRRQKSLKKLLASSSDAGAAGAALIPPVPVINNTDVDDIRLKRTYIELERDAPVDPAAPMGKASKKGILSRAKSKPSLRIEVITPRNEATGLAEGTIPTPALGTASASGQSDAYPITPLSPEQAAPHAVFSTKDRHAVRSPLRNTRESGVQSAGGIRGLSKRFSLSNMSGAFRKRASISTMVALPSESELPVVPDIPAGYRKANTAPKRKDKGKQRAVEQDVDLVAPGMSAMSDTAPTEGSWLSNSQVSSVDHRANPRGHEWGDIPHAGPSRSTPRAVAPAVEVDFVEPFAPKIESAYVPSAVAEVPAIPTISPPSPRAPSEGRACGKTPSPSPPLLDIDIRSDNNAPPAVLSIGSRRSSRRGSADLDASSISSFNSLDDTEHSSIVHAQLMQVSPATRRNPGISVYDFVVSAPSVGSAPVPQLGVLVSSPIDKRRSVQAIIQGSPIDDETPKPATHRKRDSVHQSRRDLAAAAPLIIDLRGQYLKRIEPSASKGAHVLLGKATAEAFSRPSETQQSELSAQSPATALPIQQDLEAQVDCGADDRSSESESDKDEVPATPTIEDLYALVGGIQPSEAVEIGNAAPTPSVTSLTSSDSGLVMVSMPSSLSPEPLAFDANTRSNTAANGPAGSRASTPRSRFTTPEALLRLLASPLAASRLSRSTPGSNGSSGKGKKSLTSLPVPVDLEGMPPMRGGAEIDWNALLAQSQLGSLHFDGLGLDLAFDSEPGQVVEVDGQR